MARLAKFNITIKSQQARTGAPLSPLLGQYGINCQEFCNLFNTKTKEVGAGIPVRILFRVLPDKKFEFTITKLVFGKLLRMCGLSRRYRRSIDPLTLFKVYMLSRCSDNTDVVPTVDFSEKDRVDCRSLLCGLKSNKLRIRNESTK